MTHEGNLFSWSKEHHKIYVRVGAYGVYPGKGFNFHKMESVFLQALAEPHQVHPPSHTDPVWNLAISRAQFCACRVTYTCNNKKLLMLFTNNNRAGWRWITGSLYSCELAVSNSWGRTIWGCLLLLGPSLCLIAVARSLRSRCWWVISRHARRSVLMSPCQVHIHIYIATIQSC